MMSTTMREIYTYVLAYGARVSLVSQEHNTYVVAIHLGFTGASSKSQLQYTLTPDGIRSAGTMWRPNRASKNI